MNGGENASQNQNNLSVFLLGAILNILAAVDYTSLFDYSIKAIVGGSIWLAFKVAGEILRNESKERKQKGDRSMIKGKYLLLGGIAGAVVAGGVYLLKMNRLSVELQTVAKAMIYKITASAITVRIDLILKNPTAGSIKVKYPFLKINYNGKTIGSSDVQDKDFTVPKFGQIQVDPIYITVTLTNIGIGLTSIIKELIKKTPAPTVDKKTIQIETTTTINGTIPYKKIEATTIGGN